ncbi:MAG TPA: hypothetical protein VJ399_03070 [Patescibacteria group bacterium]|nr:hypothetical protein [Patescibacteria group bacterium]
MGGKLPTQTYHQIDKDRIDFEFLRNKLKLKHIETVESFKEKHPNVHKYLTEKSIDLGKIREHSAKIIGAGALTSTLLISPPSGVKTFPPPAELIEKLKVAGGTLPLQGLQQFVVDNMQNALPAKTRPLTTGEEKYLEQVFQQATGIKVKATLEGEHLNTTYGLIGAEQHLVRYPGDTISQHGKGTVLKEGIAPGKGAWGYFANSRSNLTPSLENTEKWYGVVQTLYLPDWNTRQPYLRDWYKYRKILIVNTNNGNAVIAAIADSGPAAWTGKSFGGSPEVMEYLGGSKYKKGPVIVFFVDDPENKIPLGPVDYNKITLPETAYLKT